MQYCIALLDGAIPKIALITLKIDPFFAHFSSLEVLQHIALMVVIEIVHRCSIISTYYQALNTAMCI